MAPKKKSRKDIKKDREDSENVKITKTQYEEMIAEMNGILAEERTKTWAKEEEYLVVAKRMDKLKQDLPDIVAYIQKMTQDKVKEIKEYDTKTNTLEEGLKKQEAYYKTVFEDMEERYTTTKKKLDDAIEFAEAKLQVMTEHKHNLEQWEREMENVKQTLIEKEKQHTEEVYEAEKSSIKLQDMQRREMEEKLDELSVNMREGTDYRIGCMANDLIRKNIDLANELTCTQSMLANVYKLVENVKMAATSSQYSTELQHHKSSIILRKYKTHLDKIETLIEKYNEAKHEEEFIRTMAKSKKRLRRKVRVAECEVEDADKALNELRVKELEATRNVESARNKNHEYQDVVAAVTTNLNDAARIAKDAMTMISDITDAHPATSEEEPKAHQEDNFYQEIKVVNTLLQQVKFHLQDINLKNP